MIQDAISVTLICKDGETLDVEIEVAKQSEFLKGILEDGNEEEPEPIPLPQAPRKAVVEKIVVFLIELKNGKQMGAIQQPLIANDDGLSGAGQWFEDYITEGVDKPMLFEIAQTAMELAIIPLKQLACAKIAYSTQGFKIVQLREYFGIEQHAIPSFTDQAVAKIVEDGNIWIDDDDGAPSAAEQLRGKEGNVVVVPE